MDTERLVTEEQDRGEHPMDWQYILECPSCDADTE